MKVSISVDGITLKEPTLKQQEALFRPYAQELGRLVFSWNQLHANLARVFWAVTKIDDENMPLAIWHSTPSDLSQRKMLRAAIETLPEGKEQRADIIWLLDKIDQGFSHKRNEAIHAPLGFVTHIVENKFSKTDLRPDVDSGSPLAKRLSTKGDLRREFKHNRDYAAALSDYALSLFWCLFWRERGQPDRPLPDRPHLPDKDPPKTHKASSRRQKMSKAPQRQRGTSQV